MSNADRTRRWQQRQLNSGRCRHCNKPRVWSTRLYKYLTTCELHRTKKGKKNVKEETPIE